MMLSETGLIELGGMGGVDDPLCPNSIQPQHPSHQVAAQLQNAAYRATPRDDDGDPLTAEAAAINSALAYEHDTSAYMKLYRDVVIARNHGARDTAVEMLYFRCLICGLTLPGARVPT